MAEIKNVWVEKVKIPGAYYEIRLESIGGLGANLCGKMLGEMGVRYLDVNSIGFSSYGSEKTGTPVKSYVRYGNKEKEIRMHSPVISPDLLVIFHYALTKNPAVWEGCDANTLVLVALEDESNLEQVLEQMEKQKVECSSCYGLLAQKIAIENKSRLNMVMFGGILKVMGMEDTSIGEKICTSAIGKKYPDALSGNLKGMRKGYENLIFSKKKEALHLPGGILISSGNTVVSDVSPARQGFFPIFRKEKCIHCGLCFSTCPDMVFQFKKGSFKGKEKMINQGLDYYHCKGCLRCVDICPVNALVQGEEAKYPEKSYFLPNQELICMPDYYEKTGADGYITSEAYLTEKRMEGGEV